MDHELTDATSGEWIHARYQVLAQAGEASYSTNIEILATWRGYRNGGVTAVVFKSWPNSAATQSSKELKLRQDTSNAITAMR